MDLHPGKIEYRYLWRYSDGRVTCETPALSLNRTAFVSIVSREGLQCFDDGTMEIVGGESVFFGISDFGCSISENDTILFFFFEKRALRFFFFQRGLFILSLLSCCESLNLLGSLVSFIVPIALESSHRLLLIIASFTLKNPHPFRTCILSTLNPHRKSSHLSPFRL